MLIDAVDLWVRGRKMTPHSVKMFRSMVFVAVLGALPASLLGGNSLVVIFLAPAMIIYLLIARRRPGRSYAAATARGGRRSARARGGGRVRRARAQVAAAQGRQEAPLRRLTSR